MIGVKHIVSIARNSGQLAINPFAGYLISGQGRNKLACQYQDEERPI